MEKERAKPAWLDLFFDDLAAMMSEGNMYFCTSRYDTNFTPAQEQS